MTAITGDLNLNHYRSYSDFGIPEHLIKEAITHPEKFVKLLPKLELKNDENDSAATTGTRKIILIIAMLNTSKPGRLYLIVDKLKNLGINNDGDSVVAKLILKNYETTKMLLKKQTVFELAKYVKTETEWQTIYDNLEGESKIFFGEAIANSFKTHGEHWEKLIKNDPKMDEKTKEECLRTVVNKRKHIQLKRGGF